MEQKCPQCGAPLPSGGLAGLCPACLLAQAANETAQPGAAGFVPPTVEELAALFPQLEIRSLIGRGGMGAVYQARQPALDRIVALKILPARADAGPDFAERFNREARALAKLNHPNIVTVHEFGQVRGMPFFIMEYVDGLNLRQLEQAGKLSPREALQIVPQICEALQFAHDNGIVHRDIKPDNILSGLRKSWAPRRRRVCRRRRGRLARRITWRPSRLRGRSRWIIGRTFSRWEWCFTKC